RNTVLEGVCGERLDPPRVSCRTRSSCTDAWPPVHFPGSVGGGGSPRGSQGGLLLALQARNGLKTCGGDKRSRLRVGRSEHDDPGGNYRGCKLRSTSRRYFGWLQGGDERGRRYRICSSALGARPIGYHIEERVDEVCRRPA